MSNSHKTEFTSGEVESIYIASGPGERMNSVDETMAIVGRGLQDDRYAKGVGQWSEKNSCQVTLIEAEDIERIHQDTGIRLLSGEHRRNIVTRGIRLTRLEGSRFRVGNSVLEYHRPRPPCPYIESITESGMKDALESASSICAHVIVEGAICKGDRIAVA